MRVLVIGGSGFLSGAVARVALGSGHAVDVVTRGRRPVRAGTRAIVADRDDGDSFGRALASVDGAWDVVIDCIGFTATHARQDVDVFVGRAADLVFVSTDFVLDPTDRPWRVDETFDRRVVGYAYGEGKGHAERVLVDAAGDATSRGTRISIVRPCHIYGPESQLGCLPNHGRDPRLIERLRAGESLALVGGGHFLQQPIFVDDLARSLLSVPASDVVAGDVYLAAGPDVMASRDFYRAIADALGVAMPAVVEVPIEAHLAANPGHRPFCCHRVYDCSRATRARLTMPATPFAVGIAAHVRSLVSGRGAEG